MTGKNKVEVKIAGKDYTLVGVESQEYIQKVALYIDKKMNEVTSVNNRLSTAMAAVLTSINVADDYFKSCDSEKELKGQVENAQVEIRKLKDEINRVKEENKRLVGEVASISNKNTDLQLELAKREAELNEVRNSIEKVRTGKPKLHIK